MARGVRRDAAGLLCLASNHAHGAKVRRQGSVARQGNCSSGSSERWLGGRESSVQTVRPSRRQSRGVGG